MTQCYDIPEPPYMLVIGHESDALPVLDAGYYGPFDTIDEAQEYARSWRSLKGLPSSNRVPTPQENEEWTDSGWTFGIFQLKREKSVEEIMHDMPIAHYERLTEEDEGEDRIGMIPPKF